MTERQGTKLSNTGKVITGKTPSKDNPEDWGNEVLFVTLSDYKNYGKKAYSSIRMLSEIGAQRQKNRLLPPNSILVTCIGSDMGKTVVNAAPYVSNQQINAIIPDSSVANCDYLYYLTLDLYWTLRSLGGDGTAVPILNKSNFENIDILLPSLPEQKAIAAVLSSLDNKIDLLHRQNLILETMA
jgi:type I restriction enzyme S subunit